MTMVKMISTPLGKVGENRGVDNRVVGKEIVGNIAARVETHHHHLHDRSEQRPQRPPDARYAAGFDRPMTRFLEHVATAFAEIPPGSRLPAYSLDELCLLLRRGPLPLSPKRLAEILCRLGWRRHRVWRRDPRGQRRLVSVWVVSGGVVTKSGIRWQKVRA